MGERASKLVRYSGGPLAGRVDRYGDASEEGLRLLDHLQVGGAEPIGTYRLGWEATGREPWWAGYGAAGRYEVWWWTGQADFLEELRLKAGGEPAGWSNKVGSGEMAASGVSLPALGDIAAEVVRQLRREGLVGPAAGGEG